MKLSLIVAMADNNVIGIDNRLPWHLPEDLKHFKSVTMGKPMIMGRKTFESIGRPLPGRRNLVITRDRSWSANGVEVFHAPLDAIAALVDVDEAMVIGGAQIYRDMLPSADRLYVTEVSLSIGGDTFFPELELQNWREVSREEHPAEGAQPAFAFVTYDRIL